MSGLSENMAVSGDPCVDAMDVANAIKVFIYSSCNLDFGNYDCGDPVVKGNSRAGATWRREKLK